LRLLLEQQLAEERRVEEDDLKQTAAEEERIKSEIDREEEMKDLMDLILVFIPTQSATTLLRVDDHGA